MATVQNMEPKRIQLTDNPRTDELNNEVSSTSSESPTSDPITKFSNFYRATGLSRSCIQAQSDNEDPPRRSVISRNHYKSMGNINDIYTEVTSVQNSISNVDLNLHSTEIKKFDALRIPIVGYEVMEERARFTIYKLKVEDDKRDRSWLVFRRYTDFVRLYNRVKTQQPSLVLPLPGKRWFKDNFDPAFLEERVRGLQVFVNAMLNKLPNHPIVREFFCLDEPPQVFSYQPEVQAVYGALEDSISTLKMQLKQKDATIMHLQKRMAHLEDQVKNCPTCSTNKSVNS